MISFQHVTKFYANGYCANKDVTFDVPRGSAVGIIGPNGSGKTTLIRQLLRILDTSEGKIEVDEKKDYLNLLSYVPQFPTIYPALTVEESIMLVLRYQGFCKADAKKRTIQVISELGLEDIATKYCYMLSGGQQKLLAFASALVQEKPYMILDEVTSMVDILTKEKLWQLINQYKKDKGILIASHDMEEIQQICDRVVILKEGTIIFNDSIEMIGQGVCYAKIKCLDMDEAKEIFDSHNHTYYINGEHYEIVFNTITDAYKVVELLKQKTTILKFTFEYPDFYKGVMKIVKDSE